MELMPQLRVVEGRICGFHIRNTRKGDIPFQVSDCTGQLHLDWRDYISVKGRVGCLGRFTVASGGINPVNGELLTTVNTKATYFRVW